ncbi:MAG: tRNA (adenosine(37)-N6)-threonylcarbamoyltransferase complex dimerization subunit type 1 TsaB, partial [Pseudonocardiaceae bacterium]
MLVLALDTATSAVTAGLLRLPAAGFLEVLAERVTVDARAHGELLMPSVCSVLATAGVSMRDLDAVVCGVGPGPFTGLRVGMVTAAAL